MSGQRLVQLVASAAASAIAATAVNTQAAEGRARQAGTVADQTGGGLFAALLAQLLPGAQSPSGPSQGDEAAELSSLVVQQSASAAWQDNATAAPQNTPSAPRPSVPGQSASHAPAVNWLAAWSGAVAQQAQQSGGGSAAAPAAKTSGANGQAPQNDSTGYSTAPPDASLLAALQSLIAQQNQQTQATPPANATATTAIATAKGPSAPALAALIQTMKAQQAANAAAPVANDSVQPSAQGANATPGAQAPAAASQLIATLGTAANAIPSAAVAPQQHAQFTQATQYALHQGAATPVTEAQSLPLHSDLGNSNRGSNGSASGQSGQHTTNASAPAQPADAGTATADSAAQPVFAPVHDQSAAPQANTTTQAVSAANAVASNAAATASQQPQRPQTVATLQVGPIGQTPTPNVHALAVSIAAQSQAGAKQFDIRLDPPELGRVDVRLTVDATGKAQAHLAVDKPQTLELLQKDSGSLARALKDSGVQLNNNGLQFSLKGQGRQGDGSPRTPQRGRALAVTAIAATAPSSASSASASAPLSGVDIRV